ncbi:MAG: hypothetical protein P1U56_14280 [Saprospiraceae bacterium]|nr:hypothetical protein [Saprospiraceae bacterium]
MEKVNYIQQNIAFFRRVYQDERLSPYHISLYMALFQFWNVNRFQETFTASRGDIMKLSKVRSKSTYSKCLNELQEWQYITYKPSHNPFVKSSFSLIIKWTSLNQESQVTSSTDGLAIVQPSSFNGLEVVLSNKPIKHKPINNKESPNSEIFVINFFEKNRSSKIEGQKFWNHYESKGWMIGSTPIVDWEAAARKWILSTNEKTKNGVVQQMDYLHTNNKKRYDEPL